MLKCENTLSPSSDFILVYICTTSDHLDICTAAGTLDVLGNRLEREASRGTEYLFARWVYCGFVTFTGSRLVISAYIRVCY